MDDCTDPKTDLAVIKHQFADINKRLIVLEQHMEKLLINDLPHITQELMRIKLNYKWIMTIGSTIGGLISGTILILSEYFLKR